MSRTCAEDDCAQPVHAKSRCEHHYHEMYRRRRRAAARPADDPTLRLGQRVADLDIAVTAAAARVRQAQLIAAHPDTVFPRTLLDVLTDAAEVLAAVAPRVEVAA